MESLGAARQRDGWVALPQCGACGSRRSKPAGRAQGLELRRCRTCGLVRFEAFAPPEVVYRAGYHDGANEFGWVYTDSSSQDYELALAERRLEWLESHRRPGRLVDIGGGAGHFTAVATERDWEATLVEPVERTVEFARRTFGIDAVCGGIDDVASTRQSFDLISLVHVLEHFPDPVERLRRIRPRLRGGGGVFIEVPNYRSLARRLMGDRWMGWRAGEHVSLFTASTLGRTLRRAGYEVIARQTMVPGWSGLGPTAYAHFLGVQPLLARVVGLRHRALRRREAQTPGGEWSPPAPTPIGHTRGLRRAVYGSGFEALARLEQVTGLGTNLLVLARPRP